MAVNPSTLDGHLATVRRTWDMSSNFNDIVQQDERITDASAVYMMPLRVGTTVLASSGHFENAFNRNLPAMAFAEAMLQMIIKTASDLRQDHLNMEQDKVSCNGDPVHMFLETVPAESSVQEQCIDDDDGCPTYFNYADDDDFNDNSTSSSGGGTEGASSRASHGPTRKRSTTSDSSSFSSSSINHRTARRRLRADNNGTSPVRIPNEYDPALRAFMRHVPDDADILELRVWIFVANSSLDFAAKMFENIKASNAHYIANFTGHQRPDERKRTPGASTGPRISEAAAREAAMGRTYGRTLGDTERWRLIWSMELYAQVCDALMDLSYYSQRPMLERIQDRLLTGVQNPGHPFHTLSPCVFLKLTSRRARAIQCTYEEYYDAPTSTWRFPLPDHVVRISAGNQTVARFRQHYLPHHQALQRHDNVAYQMLNSNIVTTGEVPERQKQQEQQPPSMGEFNDEFSELANFIPMNNNDVDNDDEDDVNAGIPLPMLLRDSVDLATLEPYDHAKLGREDYQDSASAALRKLVDPIDSPDRSAFHALRCMGIAERDQLMIRACSESSLDESRTCLELTQRKLLTLYEERCTSSSSDISRIGCKLNAWRESSVAKALQDKREGRARDDEDGRWLGAKRALIDCDLTTFGNMVRTRALQNAASTIAYRSEWFTCFPRIRITQEDTEQHFSNG